MSSQTLLAQVLSDQQRFAGLPATEQLYTAKEVGSAGGTSPGSTFDAGRGKGVLNSMPRARP